ncbi:MAG TPA: hypothetical protein VH087_18715, partial [Thermoanaerobaculia bacterium]|nr:hypothetical protein [Thermoanaerobaculia bacterium]
MRKLLVLLASVVLSASVFAQQQLTRLLRQPAIGNGRIAFVYGGDLWIVDANGGEARRLTSDPGLELFPHFSPDGRQIAFTGEYGGTKQVYVMDAEGGIP